MPKIELPPGYGQEIGQPQTQAVVMETADGKKVAYPLVATAVISPEVLAAIAKAVFYEFNPQLKEATSDTGNTSETATS